MRPVLQLIGQGHERIASTLPALKKQFQLSDEQMERLLPSGSKTYVHDRAVWAQTYMHKAGLIERIGRGRYVLTERGKKLLEDKPAAIGLEELGVFPEYRMWRLGQNPDSGAVEVAAALHPEVLETPEDQMEQAFAQIDAALIDELLQQVLSVSPTRFEQLIVELLLAMGYGDGRSEMGRAIGKSGDGGIDGVVNEDKLGLDAVYIQAKRYAPENTVGRPALQAFIGSMTGESATKGVFVTTSSFSREAHDYVRRVQQRVVLIDGARLARLMIDHGVGVRVDKTYVLRSIDANFFEPL